MIIAVDYDATLEIDGAINAPLVEALKHHQRNGAAVILNTCRTGERLAQAVKRCREAGLVFNAVNDNVPSAVQMLGANPRKIYADMYIDDKAVKP